MKRISIYAKLFSIVGIFVLGFAAYVTVVLRSMPSSMDDSDYRDAIAIKDVIADVLPPPLYVVESYLVALEIGRSRDKSSLGELKQRWKQLEAAYAERHAYWSDHLLPSTLKGPLLEASFRSAQRVFSLGDELLLPAADTGDVAGTSAAVDAIQAVYFEHRATIDRVVALAAKEEKDAVAAAASAIAARKLMLLGMGALIALVGGLLAAIVGRSITRNLSEVNDVLARVAAGDLTERVALSSSDEFGEMADQVNRTLDAVEATFQDVRRIAGTLSDAGASLAKSAERISSGAQSQAASLEETAASLEQITATVKQSAGNAQQANQVAVGSRDVAERGGSVVAEAVSAMNQIMQASRRIGEIVTTIDEIALQTNLLALNAAVEAARAGEQGRGFAVVAAEVGNLAQRSAAAAKEVKSLIQDSLQRVEAGHSLVGESGRSLNDIVVSVKRVTDIVGEIAAASREQSIGVDQVNQAVSQMDQVTQSNAAQTQELTRTADGLASSARELNEQVSRYRVRDVGHHGGTGEPRNKGRAPATRQVGRRNAPPFDPPYNLNEPRAYGQAPPPAFDEAGADFEVT